MLLSIELLLVSLSLCSLYIGQAVYQSSCLSARRSICLADPYVLFSHTLTNLSTC